LSAVTPRPLIFISAVSRELRSARQLVANTLTFLGYQPIWQDIFGTESGDLRGLLRQQIDQCKGVVQLVGQCYGAEPPIPDEEFGRVSYTQYEALYARKRGKKVWYLFIDESFPIDPHEPEPDELRELQAAYRRLLQSDTHIFHPLTSHEALEAGVLKLRDDLTRLRRGVKRWAVGVSALLLFVSAASLWLIQAQRRQSTAIQKQGEQVNTIVDRYQKMQQALVRLAEVEAQAKEPGAKLTPEEQRARAYAVLEKQLGLPSGTLAKELPGFALELYSRSDTTPLMRARAAYALGKFDEARKLSLEGAAQDIQAYETAQRVQEERRKSAIESYKLAGQSAQKLIQYNDAMSHFREAEKLTDRDRHPDEWASLQQEIATLLVFEGKYSEAEKTFRNVIEVRARIFGPEHPDTLDSRHRLIYELTRQTKYAEAEAEARQVLKLREKVLGREHVDTIVSQYNLADTLVDQGKYAEAEALYRSIIRHDEKSLGPEHPGTLAGRVGLATALGSQGKNTEAETLYREIIRLDQKVYGIEHPNTLNDRMNLATTLQAEGKYAEAETQYRDVLKLEEKVIGPEHPDTLIGRNNLAEMLDDEGKYAEAESECRQIIGLEEKVLGPENRVTLNSRGNLAVALIAQGKFPEAEVEYKRVLNSMERTLGLEHPDTLGYTAKFATALARQKKTGEANEIAALMEERARKTLGPDNPSTKGYAKLVQTLKTLK
jgi:tetratricopeptide (TPR) repeat protein